MKGTIKGIERLQYHSNKNDRDVDGVRIHIERNDPEVVGLAVEAVFVAAAAMENMGLVLPEAKYKEALGKTLELEYNRFGRIASLAILP